MNDASSPPGRLSRLLLAAGTLFGAGGAAHGLPEPVTFAFAPPAGAAFVQREIYIETGRLGGIEQRISMASEVRLSVSQEAGRYLLHSRIERAAAARDGKPSDAAMVAVMAGAETANVVRPDGVLLRVDGMRRLYERILSTLAGEERGALEKRLRENRIEDRLRANWFETTEILAGQTLELGRDYFFDSAWPTEEGWIRYQTLLRLGPWEETRHGRRLHVHFAYVADAQTDAPGAERLHPKVSTAYAPGKPAKGFTISGSASRLVDPATLLVWRDQSVRRVRNRLEVSEELAVTVSSEEKSDITLEPAAPAVSAKPANH